MVCTPSFQSKGWWFKVCVSQCVSVWRAVSVVCELAAVAAVTI